MEEPQDARLVWKLANPPLGFPCGSVLKNLPAYAGDMKIPWSRKCQLSPVFLPGKFHKQRSLVGSSPWGHKGLDMNQRLSTHTKFLFWSCHLQVATLMRTTIPFFPRILELV